MRLSYDDYSAVGGRRHNEDARFIGRFEEHFLFLVADGLGGYAGGGSASKTAVAAIRDYYARTPAPEPRIAIQLANAQVLALQQHSRGQMKSTIALADVTADGVRLAHVGDTRIYAFLHGALVYQSVDHSAAQLAILAGRLKPGELRASADRNMLTRALGAAEDVSAEEVWLADDEYDALLLCSDGFWEPLSEEALVRTLQENPTPADWLSTMRRSLPTSEGDNQTAVAVRKEQE